VHTENQTREQDKDSSYHMKATGLHDGIPRSRRGCSCGAQEADQQLSSRDGGL
jgi:hypothetical protein